MLNINVRLELNPKIKIIIDDWNFNKIKSGFCSVNGMLIFVNSGIPARLKLLYADMLTFNLHMLTNLCFICLFASIF